MGWLFWVVLTFVVLEWVLGLGWFGWDLGVGVWLVSRGWGGLWGVGLVDWWLWFCWWAGWVNY